MGWQTPLSKYLGSNQKYVLRLGCGECMKKMKLYIEPIKDFNQKLDELLKKSPYKTWIFLSTVFSILNLDPDWMKWYLGEKNPIKEELFSLLEKYEIDHPLAISINRRYKDLLFDKVFRPEQWYMWFFCDEQVALYDYTLRETMIYVENNILLCGWFYEISGGIIKRVNSPLDIDFAYRHYMILNKLYGDSVLTHFMKRRKKIFKRYLNQRVIEGLALPEDVITIIKKFL